MLSPHTLVIYGALYIQLYHIPDMDTYAAESGRVSITPVWSYTDESLMEYSLG